MNASSFRCSTMISFSFDWWRTDAASQTVKYAACITVHEILLAECDVLADFPQHFDLVFPVTCAATSPSSLPADAVDVTGKHGQCLPRNRRRNGDFFRHDQV